MKKFILLLPNLNFLLEKFSQRKPLTFPSLLHTGWLSILRTDWNEFRNTAFAVDWFYNRNGVISAVGMLLRSKCRPGFSDKELAIINIVQSHLTNLFANLENNNTELSHPDIATFTQEFRQLTKREAELQRSFVRESAPRR